LIANLAVGPSNFTGTPSSGNLPATFEIDYIRVYQTTPQEGFTDLCHQSKLTGSDLICPPHEEFFEFSGPTNESAWSVSSNLTIIDSSPVSITVAPISANANGAA